MCEHVSSLHVSASILMHSTINSSKTHSFYYSLIDFNNSILFLNGLSFSLFPCRFPLFSQFEYHSLVTIETESLSHHYWIVCVCMHACVCIQMCTLCSAFFLHPMPTIDANQHANTQIYEQQVTRSSVAYMMQKIWKHHQQQHVTSYHTSMSCTSPIPIWRRSVASILMATMRCNIFISWKIVYNASHRMHLKSCIIF